MMEEYEAALADTVSRVAAMARVARERMRTEILRWGEAILGAVSSGWTRRGVGVLFVEGIVADCLDKGR